MLLSWPVESDRLNLDVTLFPKFGVGGSLPPVLFHLVGQPLKTLRVPGGARGGLVTGMECAT